MNRIDKAVIILAVWNIIVFVVYGLDKRKADRGQSRISEVNLLLAAALLGGAGALLGMYVFRHKTKHAKFRIGVPLLLIINIAVILFAARGFNTSGKPAVYQKITPAEAKTMMDSGDVIILDVRTEAEFAQAHIDGAILIPDTDIIELAPQKIHDKKQTILVYCRSGARSSRAAHALIELGYSSVYDFGGIIDWPYQTVTG